MGNLTGVMPATYTSTYVPITDAESVTYAYNSQNLLSTISTESTTYAFTYDVFGNATSVNAGSNELAEYTYNQNNGKLNKITYGNGLSAEYVYNELELLTEVWYTKGSEPKYLAYEYEYTSKGQVYKFVDNESGKTYSTRTSSWVATYTSTVNGGTALTYTYSYNQNGNITKNTKQSHNKNRAGARIFPVSSARFLLCDNLFN